MIPTEGQQLALDQLRAVEAARPSGLEVIDVREAEGRSGCMVIDISFPCGEFEKRQGGLPLRDRERFRIRMEPDFPFAIPSVSVPHRRWAESPHVQWGSHLCLYVSPPTEWDPSDGMFGLLDRLRFWLRQAARGELDPVGAPIHPPVAYGRDPSLPLVVPRVDTPTVSEAPWLGAAVIKEVSSTRIDAVGWSTLEEWPWQAPVGAAILLPEPLTWEYPKTVRDLLSAIEGQGVPRRLLIRVLALAASTNGEGRPLVVLLGSPMRGIKGGERRQHLEAWYVHTTIATGLRLILKQYSSDARLQELGAEVEGLVLNWADEATVQWCDVREDRPEVTRRRDEESPMRWLEGRRVAIWGCGAIGGHVAEWLVRAGVGSLVLWDKARVGPGIQVRQPYDDADIGKYKVDALRDRLHRIAPSLDIEAHRGDVLAGPLARPDWSDGGALVIEATASVSVVKKLEWARRASPLPGVASVSMLLGHRAEIGLVVVASPEASGGPGDVIRRAKVATCSRMEWRLYADEFWPSPPRSDLFHPEPGCSDPTFRGSGAEVSSLVGALLSTAAAELVATEAPTRALFLALPHASVPSGTPSQVRISWTTDLTIEDAIAGYEVRLNRSALAEMRAWASRTARTASPTVETGGLLFGERDDAARVIWVSEVTGPPPDSVASSDGFICGVAGTAEANQEKIARTRGAVGFVGVWHTHPSTDPIPSPTDIHGMWQIVQAMDPPVPRSVLVILGRSENQPAVGAYVFDRHRLPANGGAVAVSPSVHALEVRPEPERTVGLALSGGGYRAIGFHLGCLRALKDRGVLDRVAVVSGVSGGSLVAAMWAYSKADFNEFDARVTELLRRGLTGRIARRALFGRRAFEALGTMLVSGSAATAARAVDLVLAPLRGRQARRVSPPLRRWVSRTAAFQDTLAAELFGDSLLSDPPRDGVSVVINACELRTGSAFRFGSQHSGSWRFGEVTGNRIHVAEAVAASAAFPLLLPALDRTYEFLRRDGEVERDRVILTDGGVFDNLGISCLEPGRSSEHSYNVHDVDYVVSCDAGQGLLSDDAVPYWWPSRTSRSFASAYRKVQDAGRGRLHQYQASGQLEGFVMPYLGMRDERLPLRPPDLIPRAAVATYPTNFSAMKQNDLDLLAGRGEQLTRLLIDRYCPEL